MVGKVFITRTGYDPQKGKHVKDPYLGSEPTFGACRPDIRKHLNCGDHLFVITGRVNGVDQYMMGGFEIAEKVSAVQAYERFPHLRLRRREDGQLDGNIIVDASGNQHPLDDHSKFDGRIANYVIGTNPIVISTDAEIEQARQQTLEFLCELFDVKAKTPFEIMGRSGRKLTEKQVCRLREWLTSMLAPAPIVMAARRSAEVRLVSHEEDVQPWNKRNKQVRQSRRKAA